MEVRTPLRNKVESMENSLTAWKDKQHSQVAELVDARQVVNYNNNKYGLLHTIRIALSQRLICRFESCPDY